MGLTIALALSILGSVISVCSFALNRKDKSNKDTQMIVINGEWLIHKLNKY